MVEDKFKYKQNTFSGFHSIFFHFQTKSPNSMGTLISVARYPDGLWSLVNKIIQSHEEKYGYQRSLSQPVSINFYLDGMKSVL